MKLKFGLVSSFDVLCGNATYSNDLIQGINDRVQAVKIEIPLELQSSRNKKAEEKVLKSVMECDVVNIQTELALFGPTPIAALRFLKKIIKTSRQVSLTMHRIEAKPKNIIRSIYNSIKQRSYFRIVSYLASYSVYRTYVKLIKYAYLKQAVFIVHTKRERHRLLSICPKANVLVHPICWPNRRSRIFNNVDLNSYFQNELPIIGLFGFVSDYKNFAQIVDAAVDSQEYNILVAGSTHPMSPLYGREENKRSTQSAISKIIEEKKAFNNFCIITAPINDDFIQMIQDVDIVVIPYLEVGQSGSGVASMAVQYAKRVVFSETHCANELFKFLNKRPFTFDTQSNVSVLSAIKMTRIATDEYGISFDGYNFETNIDIYFQSVGTR